MQSIDISLLPASEITLAGLSIRIPTNFDDIITNSLEMQYKPV